MGVEAEGEEERAHMIVPHFLTALVRIYTCQRMLEIHCLIK
jgi:hypothetical protein